MACPCRTLYTGKVTVLVRSFVLLVTKILKTDCHNKKRLRILPRPFLHIEIYDLLGQNSAVSGNGDHLPGNELPAVLHGFDSCLLNPAAARHLHAQNGNAADFVVL